VGWERRPVRVPHGTHVLTVVVAFIGVAAALPHGGAGAVARRSPARLAEFLSSVFPPLWRLISVQVGWGVACDCNLLSFNFNQDSAFSNSKMPFSFCFPFLIAGAPADDATPHWQHARFHTGAGCSACSQLANEERAGAGSTVRRLRRKCPPVQTSEGRATSLR